VGSAVSEAGAEGRCRLMAGNNITTGKGGGVYSSVLDAEIARRLGIISAVKAKLGRDLTDAELDRLIQPTPCRRTRIKLRRKKGGG
jgi:hypothetical protein